MNVNFIDRTGSQVGFLKVVSRLESKADECGTLRTYWLCECKCGTKVEVQSRYLSRRSKKTCGAPQCQKDFKKSEYNPKNGGMLG